jgi:hypothetical protein
VIVWMLLAVVIAFALFGWYLRPRTLDEPPIDLQEDRDA